jgi:TatA/E family protein of Tat protein translocase
MPFNIGPGELILILVIALVVLGPGKLPDVASSLGKSVREFRKAATDVTEAGRLDTTEAETPAATPASPASLASPADAAPASPAAAVDAAPAESAPAAANPDAAVATAGTAAAPARDPNVS